VCVGWGGKDSNAVEDFQVILEVKLRELSSSTFWDTPLEDYHSTTGFKIRRIIDIEGVSLPRD